ncbi:MAG: TMEM165/GDT1 family protein [Elusimicrobia bacterium]|nr:TMEM165/GDT1 family protein [Elusimicrobiota bacterium]
MSASFWTFEPALFASTYGLVFLSELPDKTALATMVMASRRHPVAVFAGVTAAFLVQSVVAVVLGGALSFLPRAWVRAGAGLLFLFFAWKLWTQEGEEEVEDLDARRAAGFRRAAGAAFLVVFLAEWGDMSQLTTAALAAQRGRPLTVFLGAVSALASVTAIATVVGHNLKARLHPEKARRLAAVLFAVVGVLILARG